MSYNGIEEEASGKNSELNKRKKKVYTVSAKVMRPAGSSPSLAARHARSEIAPSAFPPLYTVNKLIRLAVRRRHRRWTGFRSRQGAAAGASATSWAGKLRSGSTKPPPACCGFLCCRSSSSDPTRFRLLEEEECSSLVCKIGQKEKSVQASHTASV